MSSRWSLGRIVARSLLAVVLLGANGCILLYRYSDEQCACMADHCAREITIPCADAGPEAGGDADR